MLHFQNISVRHLADSNLVVDFVTLWEEKNMQLGPMGAGGAEGVTLIGIGWECFLENLN